MAYVRPMDILLKNAIELVPREHWEICPKCGQACPLMFGANDDSYHCAICQIELEVDHGARA